MTTPRTEAVGARRETVGARSEPDDREAPEGEAQTASHLKRGFGVAATLNVGGGARIYRSDGCGASVKVDDFGHTTLITGSRIWGPASG